MPNRISLENLYDDHSDAIFGFLLNLTRNEADARDLLQDLFVKVARKPACLDCVVNPRPFLLRSGYNLFVDLIRRRKLRDHTEKASASDEYFEPYLGESDPKWKQQVAQALGLLPPEQRAVLHLKIWEDYTFAEIGTVLGVSDNTAASRYRYALDKMEASLRPTYKELYE